MSKIKTVFPELLSPAGDMARFQRALYFGADAIYVGGSAFSMRAAPANFTAEELKAAVDAAHKKGTFIFPERLPSVFTWNFDCLIFSGSI